MHSAIWQVLLMWSKSECFWRWCITINMDIILDTAHCLEIFKHNISYSDGPVRNSQSRSTTSAGIGSSGNQWRLSSTLTTWIGRTGSPQAGQWSLSFNPFRKGKKFFPETRQLFQQHSSILELSHFHFLPVRNILLWSWREFFSCSLFLLAQIRL